MSKPCWTQVSALQRSTTATSIPTIWPDSPTDPRALSKPGQTDRAPEMGIHRRLGLGMSRVEDYFETDKSIDAKRVAIHGVSRLGKTVMWAGAHDQRFAAVIASCSGEGGAALSHRNSARPSLTSLLPRVILISSRPTTRSRWLPRQGAHGRQLLIALIAPAALLQTGNTETGPTKGEFLAAVAAGPVYKLLGKQDLGTDVWPAAKTADLPRPRLLHARRRPRHGPSDWDIYLQFLKKTFHPEP